MNEERSYIKGYFGENWGYIQGKRYITNRERNKHFCYKHHGWGLELDLFEQIRGLGTIEEIVVRCSDRNQVNDFVASVQTWKIYGVVDRLRSDFGRQIFLAENRMKRERVDKV